MGWCQVVTGDLTLKQVNLGQASPPHLCPLFGCWLLAAEEEEGTVDSSFDLGGPEFL